jgi:hypothetical protein
MNPVDGKGAVAAAGAPVQIASWQLLLLPVVVSYRSPSFGHAAFDLRYLIVPVAAFLGARFGLSGVVAVAIGGLTFVISLSGSAWGAIGGHPSLYLIALAVAALAAWRRDAIAFPQWPRNVSTAMFWLPVLLVVMVFVRSATTSGADARLGFFFNPSLLGYFLIFVLAARGAKLWLLAAGLLATAAVSWFLAYAGVFPASSSSAAVDMLPLQPVSALTALVFFSAGAALKADPQRPIAWGWWRWPYWSAAVLLVLWSPPFDARVSPAWHLRLGVDFAQSAALLPIVAFMLGALRGVRGVWTASGIATLLAVAAALPRPGWFAYLPIEAPFVAYAYARLGAHMTHAWTAQTSRRWQGARRAATAWLLAIATTAAIVGQGGTLRVVFGLAFAAIFCVAYFVGRRIVRAIAGSDREVTPQGWLSLLIALCGLLLIGLNFSDVAGEVLKQVAGIVGFFAFLYGAFQEAVQSGGGSTGRSADGFVLVSLAIVVLVLASMVSAGKKAFRDLRKVWQDLRVIYRYAKFVISTRATASSDTVV